MADTLAGRFARFASRLRYEDLPPDVVDKAKACILHCIGVGLAGHGSAAVRAARAAVLARSEVNPMAPACWWAASGRRPMAPRLTVRLADGTTHQMQATGDEFKLSLAEDAAIIRALTPEIQGGAEQVERLIAAVERLDQAPSVSELIEAATLPNGRTGR